jgi:hypothetical protein
MVCVYTGPEAERLFHLKTVLDPKYFISVLDYSCVGLLFLRAKYIYPKCKPKQQNEDSLSNKSACFGISQKSPLTMNNNTPNKES